LGRAITLFGLLNFIDGLWSACGGKQIVVFTTNHVEKLDPVLIRRGRMDMHIEMSYCGFEAIKTLAKNCLDIDSHRLFVAVEEQLREVDITPADIAECLMTALRAGYGEDSAMEFLIEELKKNREEAKAAASRKVKAAEANVFKTDKDEVEDEEDGQQIEYSDEVEEEDGQEIEYSDEVEEEDGQEIGYSDEVEGDGQETEYSDEVKADGQEIKNLDEVKEEDGQKTKYSEEVKEDADKAKTPDEIKEEGEQETQDSEELKEEDGQETEDTDDYKQLGL
jgi:hypothetical protein